MAFWRGQGISRFRCPRRFQIGLLVFPKVTQLDLTGPLQVFSSVPGAKLHLVWKRIEPVPTDSVMVLTPTTSFADCPQLDVICVPSGFGTDDMVNDEEMLDFLRKQAEGARCVLGLHGVAGAGRRRPCLRGYRAVTHWSAMDMPGAFGAIPTDAGASTVRHRRRRHRRDRFRVDAGLDPGRSPDRGGNSAPSRIQSRAAVQCRFTRDRAPECSC